MRTTMLALSAALLALPSCGNAQTPQDVIPALEQLAAEDNAEAIYHLGMSYHVGAGLPHDPAKALAMFRRAAELGDALASYKLGCFYDGPGEDLVEADPAVALRHKLVAAEAGYALAQQDVAALYAQAGDTGMAIQWLEKAVLQGLPEALETYASIHNGFDGIEPDPVKTAAYFQLLLSRTTASAAGLEWLAEFQQRMTPAQRAAAERIVASYRPAPTPLTIRALSGQRAAAELVAREAGASSEAG